MSQMDIVKHYLRIPIVILLEYVFQVVVLIKKLQNHLGFASKQNYNDIFYQLLHSKKFDEALRLAQREKYLDIDLVYRLKWTHQVRFSGITVQSIQSILGQIQDKLWAVNKCVDTVPMSYEACRFLLEFGLQEANLKLLYKLGYEADTNYSDDDKHKKKTMYRGLNLRKKEKDLEAILDDDMSDDALRGLIDFHHLNKHQEELCKYRQKLIRYEHLLACYENILGDYRTIQQMFDHVSYDEFRRMCPFNICLDFAHAGDSKAVETCLSFYPAELKPHYLAILSNFPETISPYKYRNLLPCLRENGTSFEWKSLTKEQICTRFIDWSWCDATKESKSEKLYQEKCEAFEAEFYTSNTGLKKLQGTLTSDLLSEWYITRALEMESKTLLLSNAIQLLHLGTELNIKSLESTHDELIEFDRIVYDCCTEQNIYLSLEEFKRMPHVDRLILMTGDSQKNCKDRFRFYVIPYLHRREQLGQFNTPAKIEILSNYFKKLAQTREQICKLIYTDLLDRIECDNFVADWTRGLDDALDDIGEQIKRIERERQVKQISTMASQTFALGDFNECYEACQLIMKKNFHECWALCCQLGMHKQFTNNEAKYQLLAFTLAHCTDADGKMSVKILDHIIELRKRDEKLQMAYLQGNM